ncbi:phosphatase PAP2 family protein [Elizabethkingia anophelis]|uniref:phosphatase PAP2 family protein n=1 Tax=Elizabethkingia anophelis TaxID=1117645 RepID=UPI000429F25F|nr:phosphatase PAP2 family protein [Elizabethkingia anophelis]
MRIKLFGVCTLMSLGVQCYGQEQDSIKKEEPAVKVQQVILKNGEVREYPRPKWHEPITNLPKDFMTTNRSFIENGNAWYLGGAVAATALLVPFDQQIVDGSRKLADNLGMSPENKYAKFGPIPKSVGAGLYMIGNGTTVLLLGAGFLTYGLMKNDYRAYATASGLLESLALSGIYVQVLKRSTGRESPFIARENGNSGGAWNPFPSFSAYGKNTPHYDAMPSGHLATIMAGFTVITTNYPDVKWLKPVGYTLIGGLCFQMMQSEVHWASDYPLALLIGYFSGRSIARRHFKKVKSGEEGKPQYSLDVIGGNAYGINTIGVKMSF